MSNLEVEHHRVARRALAADIGRGAADEHGIDAAAAQIGHDVRRSRQERTEAPLHDLRIFRPGIEIGPERMAVVGEVHCAVAAVAALRGLRPVGKHAPALARVVGRVLDPDHMSAELADCCGQPVDRRHDHARLRHLALEARLHRRSACRPPRTRSLRARSHRRDAAGRRARSLGSRGQREIDNSCMVRLLQGPLEIEQYSCR